MHFCTICEIIFLVGSPWKSNVVLEKSLKNGCSFLCEPCDVIHQFDVKAHFCFSATFDWKRLMTKVVMKSRLFIVCKTMFTIGESQAISHANRTANTRTPNCQSSRGKIWHRKILWSCENADLKFSGASNKGGDGINKQRNGANITRWISNAKVL